MIGATIGVVAAAVVSNPGPFTGCLDKNGDVHKVAISATTPKMSCGKDQTQIVFSNGTGGGPTGPQGPTGATGAPGPTGATGADGAAVDPCARIAGTYLQVKVIEPYDPVGGAIQIPAARVVSLYPGGGMSVTLLQDDSVTYQPQPYHDVNVDRQGAWTCSGDTVTARTLDLDVEDGVAPATPSHTFLAERLDWTLTFSVAAATLTGTYHYCGWNIYPNPAAGAAGLVDPLALRGTDCAGALYDLPDLAFSATKITP